MATKKQLYAEGTTVAPEKTRAEIEATLIRYGATHFGYMTDASRARIEFQAHDRRIRFDLVFPDPEGFTRPKRGCNWMNEPAPDKHAAEVRRLWRALLLAIKAKLELVSSGISIFEHEFMAHVVMPDGRTVADHVLPAVAESYRTGRVMPLLTAGSQ